MAADSTVLELEGTAAAPPRRNGELLFAEPWEGRAFGLAVALHAGGTFEWEAFRQELIAAIARWEGSGSEPGSWSYYQCWLEALERVLATKGLVAARDVEERAGVLACRPAGHDHDHDSHAH